MLSSTYASIITVTLPSFHSKRLDHDESSNTGSKSRKFLPGAKSAACVLGLNGDGGSSGSGDLRLAVTALNDSR